MKENQPSPSTPAVIKNIQHIKDQRQVNIAGQKLTDAWIDEANSIPVDNAGAQDLKNIGVTTLADSILTSDTAIPNIKTPETGVTMANVKFIAQLLPEKYKQELIPKKYSLVIKQIFMAVKDHQAAMESKKEQEAIDTLSIVPTYTDKGILNMFPVNLNVDVQQMAEKVGNTAFLQFLESFKEKVLPVFVETFKKKFDEKFEDLSNDILHCVYKSNTGYNMMVTSISSDLKQVMLVDTEFNELTQLWEFGFNIPFPVDAHVFREEYTYVTRAYSEK